RASHDCLSTASDAAITTTPLPPHSPVPPLAPPPCRPPPPPSAPLGPRPALPPPPTPSPPPPHPPSPPATTATATPPRARAPARHLCPQLPAINAVLDSSRRPPRPRSHVPWRPTPRRARSGCPGPHARRRPGWATVCGTRRPEFLVSGAATPPVTSTTQGICPGSALDLPWRHLPSASIALYSSSSAARSAATANADTIWVQPRGDPKISRI